MQDDSSIPESNSIPLGTKHCTKCRQMLDLSMFYFPKSLGGRATSKCKECFRRYREANRQRDAEYRERNREKIRESDRRYREKNRDKLLEKARQFRRDHKDIKARYRRDYYIRHAPRLREEAARERKLNPERFRVARHNRRARERSGGGKVTQVQWSSILARFDGKCAKCGEAANIQMDHVVPLAKGGRHSVDNVQPLCRECNLRKATKTEDYRGMMYRPLALPIDDDA